MIETHDPIEVLREFRSGVPEATPSEAEAAVARLRHVRPKRRRSRLVAVGLAGAAAAVAATVVAAAPWQGSSQGPSLTYKPGWILHMKETFTTVPYPGAGRYAHLVEERWQDTAAPFRVRSIGYDGAPWTERRVETGATGADWLSYDPATNTLYTRRAKVPVAAPANAQQYHRSQLESGAWKVAATETIHGRKVLKVENPVPGVTYYVDAETYSLVRLVSPGFPLGGPVVRPPCTFSGHATETIVDFTTEYLPPTDANERLTDVAAQHPHASVEPDSAMPPGFRQLRYPPQCGGRPVQP